MRKYLSPVLLLPLLFSCNDNGNPAPTETDPSFDESRRSENQGSGNRFKLLGNAEITRDPENPTNIVLKVVSTGASEPSGVHRDLRRVQLWQLDHQLNFKWAFVAPHTCGGGSPRIQLAIDSDGDGDRDFTAHGHIRPPHTACETATPLPNNGGPAPSALLWRFDDLTDELGRWEITPGTVMTQLNLPAFPYAQWDVFEQVLSAAFPNHRVLNARFLEDFSPTPGTAYYDLITVFDLTLGTEGQWQPERRGRGDDRGDDD